MQKLLPCGFCSDLIFTFFYSALSFIVSLQTEKPLCDCQSLPFNIYTSSLTLSLRLSLSHPLCLSFISHCLPLSSSPLSLSRQLPKSLSLSHPLSPSFCSPLWPYLFEMRSTCWLPLGCAQCPECFWETALTEI